MAQINFEKRANNIEKAKELYFNSYSKALGSLNVDTLTYILLQYARFLAFKCQEPSRALDLLNSALTKIGKSATKTLYLSVINLVKHLDVAGGNSGFAPGDIYAKVCAFFEKALEEGN